MGLIYRATSPSGKSYVGLTAGDFKSPADADRANQKRWSEHNLDSKRPDGGSCRKLNAAIRKYGADKFKLEILLVCDDSQLDDMERRMIKAYASFSIMGYNLTEGGGANTHFSQESKELMRTAQLAAAAHKFQDWPEVDIPRHMIRWNRNDKGHVYRGYAINKHPKCSFKVFADASITLTGNFNRATEFIRGLDSGEIVVVKRRKLPSGIRYRTDSGVPGFLATFKGSDGKVKTRTFSAMSTTEEEKLQQAIEWLEIQTKAAALVAE